MPNPRVTFRCPEHLYSQLPTDERERSQLILNLLHHHYNPTDPVKRFDQLEQRVKALESQMATSGTYLLRS